MILRKFLAYFQCFLRLVILIKRIVVREQWIYRMIFWKENNLPWKFRENGAGRKAKAPEVRETTFQCFIDHGKHLCDPMETHRLFRPPPTFNSFCSMFQPLLTPTLPPPPLPDYSGAKSTFRIVLGPCQTSLTKIVCENSQQGKLFLPKNSIIRLWV